MTLSNTETSVVYLGDGLNRRFTIPFPLLDRNQVQVLKRMESGPNGAIVDITAKVRVDSSKAYFDYPATADEEPLKVGERIILLRKTSLTQDNDLIQQATLHKESLEISLDKLTMIAQEITERLSRTVTVAPGDDNVPSVDELVLQMRELYGEIQASAKTASEDAAKAIAAAVEAYENAEKLYSTVEWYTAGTPSLDYDGSLTTVTLRRKYKADGNTLKVFVNGALKRGGASYDYVEVVDPTLEEKGDDYGKQITFNTPLNTGDQVCLMLGDTLTMPGGEIAQQAALAAENALASATLAAQSAATAKENAETFLPKQIGEVYQSQSNQYAFNLGAVPAWTGQLINDAKTLWPGLYAFVKGNVALQKTKEEYETILAEKGDVHFYVLDEGGEGNLRLPKYTRLLGKSGSMVAAVAPDYTKGTTLTRDVEYTAEQDGWVYVYGHGYSNGRGFLTVNGTKMLAYGSGDSSHNTPSLGNMFVAVKKGDKYKATGENWENSVNVVFFPSTGSYASDSEYDYPWIVASNTLKGLIRYNGAFLSVWTGTQAEYDALGTVPEHQLSFIEESEK